MRNLVFFALFFFTAFNLSAQDTLYRTDGSHQVVQVLETNKSQVKYKPYHDIDAPVFVILNTSVTKIVYQNGTTVEYAGFVSPSDSLRPVTVNPEPKGSTGRHFLSLNAVDLFTGLLTLNYEYTLESGKLTLKFPLSTGFYTLTGSADLYNESYYPSATIFGTGIGINYYPKGKRPVAYFLGPSVFFRFYNYSIYDQVTGKYSTDVGSIIGFFIQNGVLFAAGPKLTLSTDFGLGYTFIDQVTPYNAEYTEQYDGFRLKVGINVGFKF